MSVESRARDILMDMGMWWPDADSGRLRQAADAWRTFAGSVDEVHTASDHAAQGVIHNNRGEAIDAFTVFWGRYTRGRDGGYLKEVAAAAQSMAEGLEKFANAVDKAIDQLWTAIGISATVIVAGVGLTIFTAGLSDAAAGAAAAGIIELASSLGVELSATAASIMGTTLTAAAFGGVESMTLDAVVAQPLKIATGLQDSYSLKEVGQAADSGMVFGGALGFGGGILRAGAQGELANPFAGVPKYLRPWKLRPDPDDEPLVSRPPGAVKACNDPVDVATGEMLLPQTDLELPGALPLVFRRTHFSSCSVGRSFGQSWMSTLDECVQLDADGVVFAAADGVRLVYPVPEPGVVALPRTGARWPLEWDGRPDGVLTITDPDTGMVRTFETPVESAAPGAVLVPVASWSDRNGHRIDVERDHHGTPTALRHSGGYFVAVDTLGPRVTALRLLEHAPSLYERYDRAEHVDDGTVIVRYGYDAEGRLTEVTNSSGRPTKFGYDGLGRVTSWTDTNGTHFTYTYDAAGRVVRTEGTGGHMSGAFAYDDAEHLTTYTDSLGHRSLFRHNAHGVVTEETDPLGNLTRTTWDPVTQQRLSSTDPLGNTTSFTYDGAGRLTEVTAADGSATRAVYNELGLPTEVITPSGAVIRSVFDGRGNLLSETDPLGAVTAYAYDDNGFPVSVTDALGGVRQVECDTAGLPVSVTDPLGRTTSVRRDGFGRIVEITDPLGQVTRLGWTVEGKPSSRESPDGARESWTWDGEGNLLTHTDANGGTTVHEVGTFDLPASRTDVAGVTYTFTHDTELRLTDVTNPQGRTWSYRYDAAGRLASETDFNGRTLTYGHDAAGAVTERTNGAGETTAIIRDALGRVTEQRLPDGALTTFSYSSDGDLVTAVNPDVRVELARDAVGRVLSETVNGAATTYTYDALGHPLTRTTPTGLTSSWSWDAAGQPVGLSNGIGTLTFAYDAAGRETERRLNDGAVLTQQWDSADRLTSQTVNGNAHRILQHRTYSYRPDGYISEIRDLTTGTRRFDLDPVGRVTSVRANGWRERYAYDGAGNVTTAEAPGHPDPGERVFEGTLIRRSGRTCYEHDAQGRLVRKTLALLNGQKREWTFTWNAEDRLTLATNPKGETWAYAYDALGRRTAKWRLDDDGSPVDRTTFTWNGTCLAEQIDPGGAVTTWDHLPGSYRPISQTDHRFSSGDLVDRLSREACFYGIVTDLVGMPTELIDQDGHIAWQGSATLWGEFLSPAEGAIDCQLRLPGQYADIETGLHYNVHRYYIPESACYLSPDPLGLKPADNHYGYVANPLTWADPEGLTPCPSHPIGPYKSSGAGKDLRRSASVGSDQWQFNTGHGFYRPHEGPGGVMNDLQVQTNLSPDQIEQAIVSDAYGHMHDGGNIPLVGTPGYRPLNRTVDIGGYNVGYRLSQTRDGVYRVATYWLNP